MVAPGDNVLSFSHAFGGGADAVGMNLEGGTSASAPETAAAAVVLQVARLTHDRALEGSPRAVRSFLEQTGTLLGPLPESDIPIHEGPQIDVGRAVETLLARAHTPATPGVARVAVEQRQQQGTVSGQFLTSTDPAGISLSGLLAHDWITVSPDWTGMPDGGVTYTLIGPDRRPLATTPWARLQPSAILASAGLPLESPDASRSVTLTYTASERGRTLAMTTFTLQGAGVYGIGIQNSPGGWQSADDSGFAVVRVSPTGTAQPQVPTLSAGGTTGAHTLSIPYHGNFQLSYDASGVPGATGAVAEFSAPGPTIFGNYNTFNNPNGSERDGNGVDSGSVAWIPLTGTHGTVTLNGAKIGLDATMSHVVRILAIGQGGKVVGEASGGSTITMNGIAAADGGTVAGGFGINAAGDDGFLTSNQVTASGAELGSVETFSQSTGATKTVTSSSDVYKTSDRYCSGMLAGDVGLYKDAAAGTQAYHLLSPVASGTDGGIWSPPSALGDILCVASNQSTGQDAVLSSNGDLYVTPANVAIGTFGTRVDISPELKSLGFPVPTGFAVDPATDEAFVAVSDLTGASPSVVVTVGLRTGQVGSLPAMPGFETGLAFSPAAGKALEGGGSEVGIYDLATGTATLASPGGAEYWFPAAIPGTSDFLVAEITSPDFLSTRPNNNTLSSVVLLDDQGNVLHRFEQFNFYNTTFQAMGSYIQANPTTSTAFTVGPDGVQIAPFSYDRAGFGG